MVRHDPGRQGRRRRASRSSSPSRRASFRRRSSLCPATPAYRSAWQETIKAAEEANEPGRFTAFIGYEWTSNTGGNNLHRNVIFRDDGAKASLVEPYTTSSRSAATIPRDLWKWMAAYEEKTGGEVLAIAHNGNLSATAACSRSSSRSPASRSTASTPRPARAGSALYEATQIKGDGETHPFLSPNDEFAGFERWDKGNLDLSEPRSRRCCEFEYARSALKNGLKLEAELGVNPYKFGMIGSTDAHTGPGRRRGGQLLRQDLQLRAEPDRARRIRSSRRPRPTIMGWETDRLGLRGGVGDREHARGDLRRHGAQEIYATTGPRMIVRFFGGWDFDAADAQTACRRELGYTKGVPMGGDLRHAPAARRRPSWSPRSRTRSAPISTAIQIVKGWLDAKGELHEKVYDVAWSRRPQARRGRQAAGRSATRSTWRTRPGRNTIGAPELIAVWKDPDFDPAQRAFYYGRVIEIPTPRWTAYDAKYFGVKMPKEVPMTTQERAYTSPIWYTPGSERGSMQAA